MEWADEDRGKVIAWRLEEAERCGMCGTAAWEWQENRFAYKPVQHMCHGCYMKEIANEVEGDTMPGVSVVLVPSS